MVRKNPVDLLGHGPVEGPQAGLYVADANVQLGGGQRAGEHRVRVTLDVDQAGRFLRQYVLDARQHLSGLAAVAPEPTSR